MCWRVSWRKFLPLVILKTLIRSSFNIISGRALWIHRSRGSQLILTAVAVFPPGVSLVTCSTLICQGFPEWIHLLAKGLSPKHKGSPTPVQHHQLPEVVLAMPSRVFYLNIPLIPSKFLWDWIIWLCSSLVQLAELGSRGGRAPVFMPYPAQFALVLGELTRLTEPAEFWLLWHGKKKKQQNHQKCWARSDQDFTCTSSLFPVTEEIRYFVKAHQQLEICSQNIVLATNDLLLMGFLT